MLQYIIDSLARPPPNEEFFSARVLEHFPGVRIGIDALGHCGLFVELRGAGGQRRAFVLTSMTYDPDVRCRFDGSDVDHQCALLRCTASERATRELFLRVVESWLPTIPANGIGTEIDAAVACLIDLFDALERPARGDVLGLWGEMFVILAADDPRELLRAWRCDPFELHDFVGTGIRLEMKTSIGVRRHHFSLEQLQPPSGICLVIGSVVTKPTAKGVTIADLRTRLLARVSDPQLAFRIEQTIASTLGERWSETTLQPYSWEHAVASIVFYDGAIVPRVSPEIPPEVSQVRFAVELEGLPSLGRDAFPGLGALSGIKRQSAASTTFG